MRFLQLESEDLRLLLAYCTEPALTILTNLAFIEMFRQDSELPFEGGLFVTVIDVIQIFEAEDISFEAVVESPAQHLVHEFGVADGVIHEMELSPQDEEIVEFAISLDQGIVIVDLDYRLLEIAFYAFVAPLGDVVSSQIELLFCFVWDLDSLFSSVVIAKPFSEIVAVIEVASQIHESWREGLFAFEAFAFFLAGTWTWFVMENLELVFEFLVEEVFGVAQVPRFQVQVQGEGSLYKVYVWFYVFKVGVAACRYIRLHILTRLCYYLLLQFSISLILLFLPQCLGLFPSSLFLSGLLLLFNENVFMYYFRHLLEQLLNGLSRFNLLQIDCLKPLMVLSDIGGLNLHLCVSEEADRCDITLKGVSFGFDIDVEVRQSFEQCLHDLEDLPGMDQQCQEYSDLFICHLIHPFHDIPHLRPTGKLPLQLAPIIAAAILFIAILVAHSLLEDLHKFAEEDAKLLVLGLLAEGEFVEEWLCAFLELFSQLGVEVELLSFLCHMKILKSPPSECYL